MEKPLVPPRGLSKSRRTTSGITNAAAIAAKSAIWKDHQNPSKFSWPVGSFSFEETSFIEDSLFVKRVSKTGFSKTESIDSNYDEFFTSFINKTREEKGASGLENIENEIVDLDPSLIFRRERDVYRVFAGEPNRLINHALGNYLYNSVNDSGVNINLQDDRSFVKDFISTYSLFVSFDDILYYLSEKIESIELILRNVNGLDNSFSYLSDEEKNEKYENENENESENGISFDIKVEVDKNEKISKEDKVRNAVKSELQASLFFLRSWFIRKDLVMDEYLQDTSFLLNLNEYISRISNIFGMCIVEDPVISHRISEMEKLLSEIEDEVNNYKKLEKEKKECIDEYYNSKNGIFGFANEQIGRAFGSTGNVEIHSFKDINCFELASALTIIDERFCSFIDTNSFLKIISSYNSLSWNPIDLEEVEHSPELYLGGSNIRIPSSILLNLSFIERIRKWVSGSLLTSFTDETTEIMRSLNNQKMGGFNKENAFEQVSDQSENTREIYIEDTLKLLEFFIELASECWSLNSFNVMSAIIQGCSLYAFSSTNVAWDYVWSELSEHQNRVFQEMKLFISRYDVMSKTTTNITGPSIPILSLMLHELISLDKKDSSRLSDGKLVNFFKFRKISSVLKVWERHKNNAKYQAGLPPVKKTMVRWLENIEILNKEELGDMSASIDKLLNELNSETLITSLTEIGIRKKQAFNLILKMFPTKEKQLKKIENQYNYHVVAGIVDLKLNSSPSEDSIWKIATDSMKTFMDAAAEALGDTSSERVIISVPIISHSDFDRDPTSSFSFISTISNSRSKKFGERAMSDLSFSKKSHLSRSNSAPANSTGKNFLSKANLKHPLGVLKSFVELKYHIQSSLRTTVLILFDSHIIAIDAELGTFLASINLACIWLETFDKNELCETLSLNVQMRSPDTSLTIQFVSLAAKEWFLFKLRNAINKYRKYFEQRNNGLGEEQCEKLRSLRFDLINMSSELVDLKRNLFLFSSGNNEINGIVDNSSLELVNIDSLLLDVESQKPLVPLSVISRDYLYESEFINYTCPNGLFSSFWWEDGSEYHGDFLSRVDGTIVRHGLGKHQYPANKGYYLGYWNDGRKHGLGIQVFPNGDRFEGIWINGLPSKLGIFFYSSSLDNYYGEIRFNVENPLVSIECCEIDKHGVGRMRYNSGNKYTGYFKDDLRDGIGLYEFNEGNEVFFGEWQKGFRIGYGVLNCYGLGSSYAGFWWFDKKFAKGIQLSLSSEGISCYDGEWVHGKPHGRGSVLLPDGQYFVGAWNNQELSSLPKKLNSFQLSNSTILTGGLKIPSLDATLNSGIRINPTGGIENVDSESAMIFQRGFSIDNMIKKSNSGEAHRYTGNDKHTPFSKIQDFIENFSDYSSHFRHSTYKDENEQELIKIEPTVIDKFWMEQIKNASSQNLAKEYLELYLKKILFSWKHPLGNRFLTFCSVMNYSLSYLNFVWNPSENVNSSIQLLFPSIFSGRFNEETSERSFLKEKLKLMHPKFVNLVQNQLNSFLQVFSSLCANIPYSLSDFAATSFHEFFLACIGNSFLAVYHNRYRIENYVLHSLFQNDTRKNLKDFGYSIGENITTSQFQPAIEIFESIPYTNNVMEKLSLLIACQNSIIDCLKVNVGSPPGADEMLPLFEAVIFSASVPQLYSETRFIEDMMPSSMSNGREGYVFASLNAVIEMLISKL